MTTVFEVCTTEEQLSVVCFMWTKGLNAKYIHKEMFPVYDGKELSRKAVYNRMANISLMTRSFKRKWLRQQSKDFYVAGFHELVKRWDKCINAGGGYV
jgi:hypothetical protein